MVFCIIKITPRNALTFCCDLATKVSGTGIIKIQVLYETYEGFVINFSGTVSGLIILVYVCISKNDFIN